MTEQSQREEMSAAIRAQRERQAVPRSVAPAEEQAAPPPQPAARKGLLARLLGK